MICAVIPKNPFTGIPTREEDTVFRKPFNAEELTAVYDAAGYLQERSAIEPGEAQLAVEPLLTPQGVKETVL